MFKRASSPQLGDQKDDDDDYKDGVSVKQFQLCLAREKKHLFSNSLPRLPCPIQFIYYKYLPVR